MLKALLQMIYPSKCVLCRKILQETEDEYICQLCYDKFRGEMQHLLKENQILQEVESVMESDGDKAYEEACFESAPRSVPRCVCLFPYVSEYRSAVLKWKYKGIRKYAKAFSQLLVEEQKIFQQVKADLLIPVPLAPSRLKKRGFNQALDLAIEVGKLASIPVWDCLERNRDTKPQAACSREERYQNIRGSIQVKESFTKANQTINNVVMIDDIYTTGSTVKECIKELKKAFVFRDATFYIVVVAKGNF